MSGRNFPSAIFGMMSAALPRSPTERGSFFSFRCPNLSQCIVEVIGHRIDITCFQSSLDPVGIHFDNKTGCPVHRGGEGLSSAHSAEPHGQQEFPRQRTMEVLHPARCKCLVGSLQNSLRANIYPTAHGSIPVHRKAKRLQAAKFIPRCPLGDRAWRCSSVPVGHSNVS